MVINGHFVLKWTKMCLKWTKNDSFGSHGLPENNLIDYRELADRRSLTILTSKSSRSNRVHYSKSREIQQ